MQSFVKLCLLTYVGCVLLCSTTSACSEACDCRFGDDDVIIGVDCSNRDLEVLPKLTDHYETAITSLDLSRNRLSEFPALPVGFHEVTYLDLTQNDITMLQEPDVVPYNLRVLQMGRNRIESWTTLQPLIEKLDALVTVNLTGNPLTSFAALQNPNLRTLDLSFCEISKISGKHVLHGLPQLNSLILRGNPLRSISEFTSINLSSLDLSHCKLTYLSVNVFEHLPELTVLDLSHNPRLSLTRKSGEFVHSNSLKIIDLSYANMDTIEIAGFPNVTSVNLRGNLIKQLRREQFASNEALESIDLSNNAITHIGAKALHGLVMLKHLDVSFNMLRHLERDTFKHNEQLTTINLSRNFIERFVRLASQSLTHLDMSWCEVLTIDLDAFDDLPKLVRMDLSNNLFAEFPATLRSRTLQSLNLSMCRLATIRNDTFHGFPELTQLQLSGNRFTTPFRVGFFADNPYLRDIWLGDNPWRCDCRDRAFYEMFVYVNEDPMRLRDHVHLHCFSPEDVYGLTWDSACNETWHSASNDKLASQRVYSFLIITIIVLMVSICIVVNFRRCLENKEFERRETERVNNLEAARAVMRNNQTVLDQQSQLNAPDPRESHPPCYADALLLPKFTGSFASLKGKWKTDDDCTDAPISRRHRSQSEEVLSPRESVVDQNRLLRRQIIAEANMRISIYPVQEIPPRSPEPLSGQPAVHRRTQLPRRSSSPIEDYEEINPFIIVDRSQL